MLVAGVDGCKLGWLVAIAQSEGGNLVLHDVAIAPSFKDMLIATQTCTAVGVDIPIGFMERDPRSPDREARKLLGGKRASSVFPAPVRATLPYLDYRDACDASFAVSGKRISKQLFMILPKIREADEVMSSSLQNRVREVHPEVCFWALNDGTTLPDSKHTLAGLMQRAALLSAIFAEDVSKRAILPGSLIDDLFDACAAAWTASRIANGTAMSLPAEPQLDSRGLRMEIVY